MADDKTLIPREVFESIEVGENLDYLERESLESYMYQANTIRLRSFLSLFLIVALFYAAGETTGLQSMIFLAAGFLFLLLSLFNLILSGFVLEEQYGTSGYGVTEKWIYYKSGLFSKHKEQRILITDINRLLVAQDGPGTKNNYGNVNIILKSGAKKTFRNVKDPYQFRRIVEHHLHPGTAPTPQEP